MKHYSVYKHTTPKGKVYIGLTSREPKIRWANGNGYERQVFDHAIKKYGWENIESEVLHRDLNKDEACRLEIKLISQYKSNDNRYGYNISSGGELGFDYTEETIRKIITTKIEDGTVIMTWDKADEVRKIYGLGDIQNLDEIASIYGVSRHTIKRILLNEAWHNENYEVIFKQKKLLTQEDIDEIRLSYNQKGYTQDDLAKKYNYTTGGIHLIISNQVWYDEEYESLRKVNYAHKLNWELVKEIRRKGEDTKRTQRDIAEDYGIHRVTVSNILNNKTWFDESYEVT